MMMQPMTGTCPANMTCMMVQPAAGKCPEGANCFTTEQVQNVSSLESLDEHGH
jgi:hypothetical protein